MSGECEGVSLVVVVGARKIVFQKISDEVRLNIWIGVLSGAQIDLFVAGWGPRFLVACNRPPTATTRTMVFQHLRRRRRHASERCVGMGVDKCCFTNIVKYDYHMIFHSVQTPIFVSTL